MNHQLSITFLCAALAAGLDAQTCYHYPSDTPSTGTPDPRPWGNGNPTDPTYGTSRYQVQIPTSVLGNQPLEIVEIFVAPAGSHARTFDLMQVRFGHNPNPLTAQMVFNFVGFTARMVQMDIASFDTTADQWCPLGMTGPFSYDPANGMLVLEFLSQECAAIGGTGNVGLRTDPSIPFVWTSGSGWNGAVVNGGGIKIAFCTDHHGFIEYNNGGCPGSNNLQPQLSYGGSAQLGQTVDIHVAGGPSTGTPIAVLVWSFYPRVGPFDLGGFGAPGCTARVHDHFVTWIVTSGGNHTVSLPLPAGLQPGFPFWNQWFFFDPPNNALGISGSNFGRFMIGT